MISDLGFECIYLIKGLYLTDSDTSLFILYETAKAAKRKVSDGLSTDQSPGANSLL